MGGGTGCNDNTLNLMPVSLALLPPIYGGTYFNCTAICYFVSTLAVASFADFILM